MVAAETDVRGKLFLVAMETTILLLLVFLALSLLLEFDSFSAWDLASDPPFSPCPLSPKSAPNAANSPAPHVTTPEFAAVAPKAMPTSKQRLSTEYIGRTASRKRHEIDILVTVVTKLTGDCGTPIT